MQGRTSRAAQASADDLLWTLLHRWLDGYIGSIWTLVSENVGALPRPASTAGLTALTVAWPRAFLGQVPTGAMTTPGAISSLIRARARNWPWSLNTRMCCPSVMPRC